MRPYALTRAVTIASLALTRITRRAILRVPSRRRPVRRCMAKAAVPRNTYSLAVSRATRRRRETKRTKRIPWRLSAVRLTSLTSLLKPNWITPILASATVTRMALKPPTTQTRSQSARGGWWGVKEDGEGGIHRGRVLVGEGGSWTDRLRVFLRAPATTRTMPSRACWEAETSLQRTVLALETRVEAHVMRARTRWNIVVVVRAQDAIEADPKADQTYTNRMFPRSSPNKRDRDARLAHVRVFPSARASRETCRAKRDCWTSMDEKGSQGSKRTLSIRQ
ncbi:hypothetical protein C8R47DRAFT_1239083 [Mycena vitilis]|nr:hypothetical protein C8R47DRAFT_1239083 [Mycena vitilis]